MNSLISKAVCYDLGHKLRDFQLKHFSLSKAYSIGVIVWYSFADRWIRERKP